MIYWNDLLPLSTFTLISLLSMKKIWLLFFSVVLFFSFCFAQSAPLWDIQFCNDRKITNELDLTTKAGETVPLCINFTNPTPKDITVYVDFLDAIITQDQLHNRACNAPDKPKQHFGNFIVPYDKTITLSGNSTLQKIYMVKPSIWFSWVSHGCVAYNEVSKDTQSGSSMVNVIVRKVKFIDMLVWDFPVQSQVTLWSVNVVKNWTTTNIHIWLKNIWNVPQKLTISWTLSNIFWFIQPLKFVQKTFEIPVGEEIQLQTNNQEIILPAYKWFFTVNMQIHTTPIFDFNITNSSIPKEIVLGWTFFLSKTFFLPNYYLICILVIVLFFLLFRRKKKQTSSQ